MRNSTRGLVAAACVMAGVVVTGTPASAAVSSWRWQATQYEFFAYGEIDTEYAGGNLERLKVWDGYKDGHSAVLKWHDKFGNSGKVWDSTGSDDNTPGVKNVNVKEGSSIYLRLCIGEFDTKKVIRCDPDGWDEHFV